MLLLPIGILALLMIVIGLAADPLISLTTRAADQLLTPTCYIQAVLGGVGVP